MPESSEARGEGTIAGVLTESERLDTEARFGVDSEQVVRDHVISHVLAAIAGVGTDELVFFGGTALARTHLIDFRLSEDIDLIALGNRRSVGASRGRRPSADPIALVRRLPRVADRGNRG